MAEITYKMRSKYNETPTYEKFKFHTHENYEIYLFLEGDVNFIIENKTYSLEPYDIVIAKKHELHNISFLKASPYRRMYLNVWPAFFQNHNCQEYEDFFLNPSPSGDNKIPAKVVRSSGLYDAFKKYQKYSNNFQLTNTPILDAIVIEILYLINNTKQFATPDYSNTPVAGIILFLNEHYTEDISMEMLQKKFFLSKNYLCKIFKNTTGLTIFDYIRKKRLTMVQDLINEGMSMTDASRMAGFHDYSSFYRAYNKEYGISPRKNMK